MSTRAPIGEKLAVLKGPALVALILAGFILEFLIELPFRILTITAGDR